MTSVLTWLASVSAVVAVAAVVLLPMAAGMHIVIGRGRKERR